MVSRFTCFHMFSIYFIFSVVTFTQERVEQLQQLSKQPDIYERLAKALGKHVLVVGICEQLLLFTRIRLGILTLKACVTVVINHVCINMLGCL